MTVLKESQYGDFYQLGLMTGMRRGELAGLKWANVNLANQQLQVVNTLQRITGQGLLNGQDRPGIQAIDQLLHRNYRQHNAAEVGRYSHPTDIRRDD